MNTTRILCVDDDQAVLKSLEKILVTSGFEVAAVLTVPEALALISQQQFDVLLTDLNIGEPGDGFTVVSAMRRVQPNACTFILTGYPDIDSAIRAIRSQVDDYFSKPFDVKELLTAITAARNGTRGPGKIARPVKVCEFVRKHIDLVCESWLHEISNHPDLASIPLSDDERLDHLPELLHEYALQMEDPRTALTEKAIESARKHGRVRYQQGYTVPQIVSESRILQQVLSFTIQRDLLSIDLSSLVPDTFKIGESIQAALEIVIRSYQAQIPTSLQASVTALYKSPHLGVAIADEHRIIDANDAMLRMIQHSRDQLMAGAINWIELTPEEFRPVDVNAVEQLREFGACVPFEKEFFLPDGSRLPFLIGAVRLSVEPFQWSVYMVDLTKQRKLLAAEAQVREWQARSAIINQLAHEINNPLAALMFTIHLLGTHSGLSRSARELIENADGMLQRTAAVVKSVLEQSRLPE